MEKLPDMICKSSGKPESNKEGQGHDALSCKNINWNNVKFNLKFFVDVVFFSGRVGYISVTQYFVYSAYSLYLNLKSLNKQQNNLAW